MGRPPKNFTKPKKFTARKRTPELAETGNAVYDQLRARAASMGPPSDNDVKYWLPTGSLRLDLAINRGLPGGKVTEIYGDNASGKTALALMIGKQAQLQGGCVVWFDVERGLSTSLAEDIIGISRETGWIYPPCGSAEDILDAIEKFVAIAVGSTLPTVIVVDSVAAMCPRSQGADESEINRDSRVTGKLGSLMSWFFARPNGVMATLAGSNVYLILINQTRSVLDFSYAGQRMGPQMTTSGGRAARFYCSLRMEVSRSTLEEDKKGRVIGAMVKISPHKNKVGPMLRDVRLPFYFHPASPILGFDDAMSQFAYLCGTGRIQPSGAWYEIDGRKFNGKMAVRDAIHSDPEFREVIRQMVVEEWDQEHQPS